MLLSRILKGVVSLINSVIEGKWLISFSILSFAFFLRLQYSNVFRSWILINWNCKTKHGQQQLVSLKFLNVSFTTLFQLVFVNCSFTIWAQNNAYIETLAFLFSFVLEVNISKSWSNYFFFIHNILKRFAWLMGIDLLTNHVLLVSESNTIFWELSITQ